MISLHTILPHVWKVPVLGQKSQYFGTLQGLDIGPIWSLEANIGRDLLVESSGLIEKGFNLSLS